MKVGQLREMNEIELKTRLDENLDALQNLKLQQALKQLENANNIGETKKEIAQIKTVLNEFRLGIRDKKDNN